MKPFEKAWIGVDLDGTLAEYHGWVAATEIGKPIPLMVNRVTDWLARGYDVKIMTARISHHGHTDKEVALTKAAIEKWSLTHIGIVLDVVCHKDTMMLQLWDDRAVRVIENTGEIYGGELDKKDVL